MQAPSDAALIEAHGQALLRGRDFAGAVEAFARAIALDDRLASAHLGLGKALAGLGRADAADAAFDRYFALEPARAAIAEAAERQKGGDAEGAASVYRAVLERDPNNVDALRLYGVALGQLGRLDDAEHMLRRAIALAPDFVFAWNNLGSILGELDRVEEAVDAFRRAVALKPDEAQSHFNLGNALAAVDDQAGATAAYDRALAHSPGHPGCLIGKGHVLKTIGRQAEAICAYRACLSAAPTYGEVWWSLANLKTYRFSPEEIAAMEKILEDPRMTEEGLVSTLYALGKAFEDAGDFARAFDYYDRGAKRQRPRVAYDPLQTEVLNDRIVSVFTPELFADRVGQGCPDPAPIFIVGLPRSGSTLIEQILASHSLVDGTSELPDLGRIAVSTGKHRSDGVAYPEAVRDLSAGDLDALGRAYISATRRLRGGGAYFTDKMPNNFPTIGFLKLILPNAKVIDARRHPLDSCVGSYKQLFAKGQAFTYDLFEIGEYYLQYDRIMKHWDAVLPGFVLRIDYEDMLADQEHQTRRLLDFCGLPFEAECLRFHDTERAVKTASSEQVRQPIYTSSAHAWRRFEPFISDLKDRLAPVLAAMPARLRDPAFN